MKQPYGTGLTIVPDTLGGKLDWAVKRAFRVASKHLLRPLDPLGLGSRRISQLIWAKDRIAKEVSHYTVLHPARTVEIALPQDKDFLPSLKDYTSGSLDLGEVFVCEAAPALLLPYLGLVANENFEVFGDSVLLPHRFQTSPAYRSFRPIHMRHYPGPVSCIQRIDSYNFWHWIVDSLPQLLTLEQYMDGKPLTILMGDDLGGFQREMLTYVLPRTMRVEFIPAHKWIRTGRFILPSYVSGRRHGYLPDGYYQEIRRRIRKGLGLPEQGSKGSLRLYLSRSSSKRRRISNEAGVVEVLSRFGFQSVLAEKLSMREQVDLFQQAEVIAGPHGAALGGMVFSPNAKILVLYPEKRPGEYFYTMARGLGLEHFGLVHDYTEHEDKIDNFTVDLPRLEAILSGPMGLDKRQGNAG